MKNIAIVANTSFNIYNFRLELIFELQKNNFNVFAIAPKDDYTNLLLEKNIQFIEIKQLARKGTNPFFDMILCNELRDIYKKNKIDIALQYTIKPNIYGSLAGFLANTKTISTVTGLGYTFLNKSIASFVAKKLYRLGFALSEQIIFQNNDDAAIFIKEKLVLKERVSIVNGSGIDIEKYNINLYKNTQKKSANIIFLMIARLLKDKGIYEFIEAAKGIKEKYKTVEFQLVGGIDNDNPSSITMEEIEKWQNENIIYYFGHQHDVRTFIFESDCVVLPSYREGMPRVILEAQAMQKICITTNVTGCKDAIIDNNTGFLCEVANSKSLQFAMEKFINLDNKIKEIMQQNAVLNINNNFSTTTINKKYIQFVKQLC